MKKLLLTLTLATLSLSAQTTTPQMSEVHSLKIQSLIYKRTAIIETSKRLRLEFEKQIGELETQYNQTSTDLDKEQKAAYSDSKVDPQEWAIDGEGKFIPAPKKPIDQKPLDQKQDK